MVFRHDFRGRVALSFPEEDWVIMGKTHEIRRVTCRRRLNIFAKTLDASPLSPNTALEQ